MKIQYLNIPKLKKLCRTTSPTPSWGWIISPFNQILQLLHRFAVGWGISFFQVCNHSCKLSRNHCQTMKSWGLTLCRMQFIVGKPLTIDEFKILQWFHCDILYSNIPKIPRIKFLGFVLLFFFFRTKLLSSFSHLQTHCSTLNVYFYLLVRTRLIRTILFFIRLFQYASLLS